LHPIVITPDGMLVAGERRLIACKQLGWTEIAVTIVDLDDIVRGQLAENAIRKDFLPSEIDSIRRALEPIERAAAERRMEAGTPAKVSQGSGRATDKIGVFAGVSGRTVEKIAAVVAAAEADPEQFGRLVEDMDRTGRVDGPHRRLMRKAEAIRAEPPPYAIDDCRAANTGRSSPRESINPSVARAGRGREETRRATDCRCHSGLMLPARIILPHFSVSSAMNLPKSADEPANAVAPKGNRWQ